MRRLSFAGYSRTATLFLFAASELCAQSSPLDVLERQGSEAFDKRDCTAALKRYQAAAPLAGAVKPADRAGLIYRRIGICKGRLGDITGSLEAYNAGVTASEAAEDPELLIENVHGQGLALQRLGRLGEALAPAEREYALAQKVWASRTSGARHVARGRNSISAPANTAWRCSLLRAGARHQPQKQRPRFPSSSFWTLWLCVTRISAMSIPGFDSERELIAMPNLAIPPVLAYGNLGAMLITTGNYSQALDLFSRALSLATGPEACGWQGRVQPEKTLADIKILLHFSMAKPSSFSISPSN